MSREEFAAALDGNEYGEEGSPELFKAMKAAGMVAVFGASDDLMEFRGAIHDEMGCYGSGEAHITPAGLLQNDCDNDDCPHFKRLRDMSPETRQAVADVLRDLSVDARARAQKSWKQNKGPMAVYWKAVGAYATHLYRAVRP